ncbi:50S ribosomal protein L18e [Candidatus Woesearchaeota archaeon]|nr:50S ribosomal protein L18e [Candidatus Woesearchaeota archaeon]
MKHEQLNGLISELKKTASKEKAPLWNRVAVDLEKPTRKRRQVNLSRINRYTKENDFVVVPGKVLATGDLNHKLTIAAYSFSQSAKEKIQNAKGEVLDLAQAIIKNPKGKKAKIIG